MKLATNIKFRAGVECPKCKNWHSIEHLLGYKTDPNLVWYCHNENCGAEFKFSVDVKYQLIYDLCLTGNESKPKRYVVKLKENIKDLTLIISGHGHYENGIEQDTFDEKRYLYESHTCPSNIMRSVVDIFSDGIKDEHGIFKLIKEIPKIQDEDNCYTIEDVK